MNATDIYEAEGRADDDLHEADIVEWYEARPVTVPPPSPPAPSSPPSPWAP